MSLPTLIGMRLRNIPGGSVMRVCDGCKNPFLGIQKQYHMECCKMCVTGGPAFGREARAKREAKRNRRIANNAYSAALNPAWNRVEHVSKYAQFIDRLKRKP